jgi:hypothetical protein
MPLYVFFLSAAPMLWSDSDNISFIRAQFGHTVPPVGNCHFRASRIASSDHEILVTDRHDLLFIGSHG